MQRFYSPELPLGEQNITLTQRDILHQIYHVLRAKKGHQYCFFSGDRGEFIYEITDISKKFVTLDLVTIGKNDFEPSHSVHLYQALPNRWEKAELIVQKCTEIGVEEIFFFSSERSQTHDIPSKKLDRLMKICIEATEQCGRPTPPSISYIHHEDIPFEDCIVLDQGGDQKVKKKGVALSLLVGPEGGWSEEEIAMFEEKKCQKLSLGQTILRSETAAICGSYFLMNI